MITKNGYTKRSGLLGFDYLIAAYQIQLINWLGMPVIVIAGVLSCINDRGSSGGVGHIFMVFGCALLVLPIWRLISELWILAFNIYERLVEIRDLMARQVQTPAVVQPALRDGD
ncbi:DUF4282 domain-containing protein [Collimonas arenae]|nr:DUF4282 domain-containing protein [Collimonas arenae]